jgi:photosystem II stability/assembly factor-like uncharacterized protein
MSGRRGAALALGALLAAAWSWPSPQEPPPTPARSPRSAVTSLSVFAGTASGLYRSYDWGNSWHRIGTTEKPVGLVAVGAVRDVYPIGPQVYLAGDGGVYQSDDFGEKWTRTETSAPVVRVLPSRYPLSDLTVFAATPSGLLKSNDGGRTFAETKLGGLRIHRMEWPGPALLVGTSRGVRVSGDSGATFTEAGSGMPAVDARALAMSAFFSIDPVLFAAAGDDGVYRSGDGGRTWTPAGLGGETVTDMAWLGPFLYAVTANGMFRSEDMGRSWTQFKKGLEAAPTRFLFPLMPTSGTEVFLGTVNGVYHSGDGGMTWQKSGLEGEVVLCLATFPQPESGPGRGRKK